MTDQPSIALVLLADEKLDVSIDIKAWHLEKYESVIVASRDFKPVQLLECIEQKNPNVQYLPLDGEEVFQRAKSSYLTSLTRFRKWFYSRSSASKHVWWLTPVSFPDECDPVFRFFLCLEVQRSIRDNYADYNIECSVVTDEPCAHLFDWEIPTTVMCPGSRLGAILGRLLSDFYSLGVNIVSRTLHAIGKRKATSWREPVDVCFIAFGGWERHGDAWRDRAYTDLPQHFRSSGLSVVFVCPEDEIRYFGERPPVLEGIIHFGFCATLLAACETARFALQWMRRTIRYLRDRNARRSPAQKALLFCLLTGNRGLFGNLLKLYGLRQFFRRNPTKTILMYTELYQYGRALRFALDGLPASRRPVFIGFQHGFVSDSKISYLPDSGDAEMPFPACEYFFAYNEVAARLYSRLVNGERQKRVRIVGMHRIESTSEPASRGANGMNSLDNLDPKRPVFLFIGSTPERMEDAWAAICRLSHSIRIQVIIKPHPNYSLCREWLARFDTRHGSSLWCDQNYELDWAISVSDYVLVHASTAALNVIAQKKRMILLALDERFDVYQLRTWLELNNQAHTVRSQEQLESLLSELARTKPSAGTDYVGSDVYLSPFLGRDSIDAMCREVKRILAEKPAGQ